jgi:hypothetical protein
MSIPTSRFTNEKAPCKQVVDGERYRDRDDECLLSDELSSDCGCRSNRYEYHDGSVSSNAVRQDGTALEDEIIYGQ